MPTSTQKFQVCTMFRKKVQIQSLWGDEGIAPYAPASRFFTQPTSSRMVKGDDDLVNRYVPNGAGGFDRQVVFPGEPQPQSAPPPPPPRQEGLGGIFQRFLPKNLDTGDLLVLIIVLLLLLEREEGEDYLPLLITVASFLFLR